MQWFMQACMDVAGTNAAITLSSTRVAARSVDTIKFFEQLLLRYFGIIDQQLARQEYLASELSIADFALFPHFVRRKSMIVGAELRHLQRWGATLGSRPGVIKGMTLSA